MRRRAEGFAPTPIGLTRRPIRLLDSPSKGRHDIRRAELFAESELSPAKRLNRLEGKVIIPRDDEAVQLHP